MRFQGQATKTRQRENVYPFLFNRGWTLPWAELCAKAAFSGFIHSQRPSTVCWKLGETWDKRAYELENNFCTKLISGTDMNHSSQTWEIWIKRPWNRENLWTNCIKDSFLHAMVLPSLWHQDMRSLPHLSAGERKIFWLPSALLQCQQAGMNLSPSFRRHREIKPSQKKVLVSSESSRSGCEMVFRPYPSGRQGDPAMWLSWGIYHVPCSYLYCLKSQNEWACKEWL